MSEERIQFKQDPENETILTMILNRPEKKECFGR